MGVLFSFFLSRGEQQEMLGIDVVARVLGQPVDHIWPLTPNNLTKNNSEVGKECIQYSYIGRDCEEPSILIHVC
jgi:hypothetical protein